MEITLETHPRFNILISACGTIIMNPETDHIYKQHQTSKGYMRVEFRHKHMGINKREKELVHRLVAETYLQKKPGKPEVDHINRDRSDNRIENLRWVNRKQNLKNRSCTVKRKRGKK